MRKKIIGILVCTLLITTAIPAVGLISNNDPTNSGHRIEIIKTNSVEKTSSTRGFNVAVINEGEDPGRVKQKLEQWGVTVDLIDIADITVSLLSEYCAVWVPVLASYFIDNAGKDDEIQDYVFLGGGLIFCQPNWGPNYVPQSLPYTWEILDSSYFNPCGATIVDPTHELTIGLTVADMPDAYDISGTIASEYTILALSAGGDASLGCAAYGMGRVIVQLDAEVTTLGPDMCGDNPALSENMVMRMLEWVCKGLICCDPVGMDFGKRKPGAIVTGEIHVCNCGSPGSLLDWYVDTDPANLPPWGTWVFNPVSGTDVPEEQCDIIQVSCQLTETQGKYSGSIYVYNADDPSDFCEVKTHAEVPRNRGVFFNFFEYLINQLAMLKVLFGF